MIIKTYGDSKKFLGSFINYEKSGFSSYQQTLNLNRVILLLKHLGIAYKKLKVIHIAGTKGKGSTAHFCAYLLASLGKKVGLYSSPHFFDFRERIKTIEKKSFKFKESLISKGELVKIAKVFNLKLKKFKLPSQLGAVTFFEIYTALAFRYFLDKKLDFIVLETGLGGRLDATNVVNPLLSVITHIGYDHIAQLGSSLSKIAYEKSAIIKKNTPVISACQKPKALREIKKKSKDKKSSLFILDKDILTKDVRLKDSHTLFNFKFKSKQIKDLKITLKGKHQVQNSALSLAAIFLLQKELILDEAKIKQGLINCQFPGRFELVSKKPPIVLDVAHNKSSFNSLRDNLNIYFPNKKPILIFACCSDKDAKGMVGAIRYSKLILTQFKGKRVFSFKELREALKEKKAFSAKNIKEALGKAIKLYKKDSIIVIAGSFSLVGEAKKLFLAKSKGF